MKGLVWGKTINRAIKQLQQIENDYNSIGINTERVLCSRNNYTIYLENGDQWQAILANEASRGRKANISYVDINIDEEFVNTIIKYSTMSPPYHAIQYF